MIFRARAVVTMDGEPIANGAVAVVGNKITDVGPWPEIRARSRGDLVDLGENVLLPGLINAHCHLDYTVLRGAIPPQPSFTGWIQSINEQKTSLTPDDYVRSIEAGLAEAEGFGTTTIANLEAFPDLVPRLAAVALRIWWFAEMIDVRAAVAVPRVQAKLQEGWQRSGNLPGGVGLAPHAPYTASETLYAETVAVAAHLNLPATTHLAESRDEMEMFRRGSGPLFDFMRNTGRPMDDCGQTTPLRYMLQRGLLDERWIVAHLNELTPDDFTLLESAPRFHAVHCPRSHAYFGHSPFPLTKLRASGFNVCLGTDSLASNADLSLFAEMRQLLKTEPSLRAREILQMVTVNPAAALGQGQVLGRIRPGYMADLVAVPLVGPMQSAEDETISFSGKVPWLMVNGDVVRGARE